MRRRRPKKIKSVCPSQIYLRPGAFLQVAHKCKMREKTIVKKKAQGTDVRTCIGVHGWGGLHAHRGH